ncbi:uncharacterized protein LOC107981376 [Nasonia vitripennis]|uniref:Uncharacterized protein n=1 Tax=Nasonia vitripennis TaxID=7425 RepID=A0A7M7IZR0_NASVI|nr:uncharacterized protein LOC107981376 [Nasonia vitripennis]
MQYLDIGSLDIDVEEKKNLPCNNFDEKQNQIRILHSRKTSEISGMFKAPPGVNPFHVGATKIKKFSSGGSKLVFIWPQKASSRRRMPNVLIPIFRLFLEGFIILDRLHLWPGEFMPSDLPAISPTPLPPIKCNVIEPRWFDSST